MLFPLAPIQVAGRRLRAVRLSPVATTIALALLVVAFGAWLAALFTSAGVLAAVAGVCAGAAVLVAALYTWRRLDRRGRLLFGIPVALNGLAICLAAFELPGAGIAAAVAAVGMIVALALGLVEYRSGFGVPRSRVDRSFLRSEEPAEPLAVRLDQEGLHFGPEGADGAERWRREEVAAARLDERGDRLVLRVTDRVGDEVAVELDVAVRAAARELVARLGVPAR